MFHLYSTRVLVFTAVQTMALSKILAEVDSMAATVFVAVVVASLIYLKSSPPPPKAESTATPASVGALMRARRSIFPKDFASDPQIPREAVERALACANWAPTHGKTEPWRFVVFEGPSGVDKFLAMKHAAIAAQPGLPEDARKAALTKAEKKAKDLRKCAYIIAICVKRLRNASDKLMPMWEEVAATSMAVQNLHLALWTEKAYGYWSSGGYKGWLDVPDVRSMLGMDGDVDGERDDVLGFFFVGAATEEKVRGYRAKRGDVAAKTTWY